MKAFALELYIKIGKDLIICYTMHKLCQIESFNFSTTEQYVTSFVKL